ncbi:hypothetical protein HBH84_074190 [Parastagonospora nodorum]|nr:hypothetical protein HBH84_074190 [Parastagonospora nodorum]
MSQTNIREEYRIITLEVVELIEDLISYTMMLAKVRQYSAKVKIENLSNTLILTLSKTAQRRSSSVMSNRSIALITDKFGVALLTEPAILNDANVALVDAVIDALMMTLIKDDDDLLGTVNSYIKLRRLRARCKTEAADSRYAKASGGRTKKDKDLEDSDTSSDVLRLCRRDRAAARARLAERKHLLDSDDYRSDSSSDINSKDNLEDKEAMTAKDLHVRGLVTTLPYTSLQTHTSSTSKSYYLIIDTFTLRTRRKCKMRKQKAMRQNTTQLMIIISYVLLKARERSTARAKGALPLTLNLNKQLQ